MTTYRPHQVNQLDGSQFSGLNCTPTAGAMALDRETLGAKTTTGARVRQLTGDTFGGTNQHQVAAALYLGWRVALDVETPIATSVGFARLDAGMGMMLAGQSAATKGTRWSASETFTGNHQWFVNERRRNANVAGGYEHLVFDPLADGRRPSIAKSPFWVPENVVLDFARRLDLDGQGHPLGYGKLYAVFTRDTEPHPIAGAPASIGAMPRGATMWVETFQLARLFQVRANDGVLLPLEAPTAQSFTFEAWAGPNESHRWAPGPGSSKRNVAVFRRVFGPPHKGQYIRVTDQGCTWHH